MTDATASTPAEDVETGAKPGPAVASETTDENPRNKKLACYFGVAAIIIIALTITTQVIKNNHKKWCEERGGSFDGEQCDW